MERKITKVSIVLGMVLLLFFAMLPTVNATVETGWPAGKPNVPKNPWDAFIDFEDGSDTAVISTSIPGIKFTTTFGINWRYGDIRTGKYNVYPYGSQAYETNGNFFAWLGVTGDAGRIDFTKGTATYMSVLTSTASGVTIDAYDSSGNYLATSGWAGSNIRTRTFTRLTVESPGIAYVIIHDTGNYWLIDDLCTDAPGVTSKIIDIDIKPGSYPNSINPYSKGVIPVAILTTNNFDATSVDPATIWFLGTHPARSAIEDVDEDGDMDMILHFKTQDLDFSLLKDEGGEFPYAYLIGETYDGLRIEGKDTVRLIDQESTLLERILEWLDKFPLLEKLLSFIL